MIGDAMDAFDKISDQSGDPDYKNGSGSSGWTGGFFEFKVRALINAQNGIGSEIISYFPASPEDLFELEYKRVRIPTIVFGRIIYTYIYVLEDISSKRMLIDLPIINWDLNQYASSIKIEIEEVDLTETIVTTDTSSVKFASNFSIDGGVLKKIGLKFGASLATNATQTIQRTITLGNDELGEVIINFADDVVVSKFDFVGYSLYSTRKYGKGWYEISVEPLKVQ